MYVITVQLLSKHTYASNTLSFAKKNTFSSSVSYTYENNAQLNVHVFLVLKYIMYCIYMYTSVWQRVKTLLWYNCCQIENIHGIISVHFPVCLNISHRDANFHCITTKNKINLYILSQPYTCSTYKHSHNLYTSWSHLSYLKGTSNATATKLNSFFRGFWALKYTT